MDDSDHRNEPTSQDRRVPVLDYGRTPPTSPRYAKCVLAIAFALGAIPLGTTLVLDGAQKLCNVRVQPTEYDARGERRNGLVLLLAGGVLLIPGLFYGTAAVRELLRRR